MTRDDRIRRGRTPTVNSLVASAAQISDARLAPMKVQDWQAEAWRYYDSIGELRFATNYTANALSQFQFHAGRRLPDGTVERLDEGPASNEVERLTESGLAGMLRGLGTMLSIPGIGYLIGEVPTLDGIAAAGNERWFVTSQDNIELKTGAYRVREGSEKEWRPLSPESVVVQVWQAHPAKPWLPDSPTRPALDVLATIEMLGRRIRSDGMSRLAGAGVFVVPTEASFSSPTAQQDASVVTDSDDPLLDALVDAMVTPIGDPESAAAVVPLLLRVPGEFADKLQHLRFSTDFDARLPELLEGAIRRLAIAVDLPPEILLGLGDVNHWSAWAIEDSAIKFHSEPLADVVAQAFTIGFLQPALQAAGINDPALVVMADSSNLRARTDRSTMALELSDRTAISDNALLRETGFGEGDKPDEAEKTRKLLVNAVMNSPSLLPVLLPLIDPTLPPIADPTTGAPPGQPATPALPAAPDREPPQGGAPEGLPSSGDPLVSACDQLVWRAMERAGNRLRSRLNAATPDCPASEFHTRLDVDSTSLDVLLDAAWVQAGPLAERHGIEADTLIKHLDDYTRWLLVTGTPHTFEQFVDVWDGGTPVW